MQPKSAAGKAAVKRGSGPAAARKISPKADTRRDIAAKSPTGRRAAATDQAAKKNTRRPPSARTGSPTTTRSGSSPTQKSGASNTASANAKTGNGRNVQASLSTASAKRAAAPGAASRKLPGSSSGAISKPTTRAASAKAKPPISARDDRAERAPGNGAPRSTDGTSKRAAGNRQPSPRPTGSQAYRKAAPKLRDTGAGVGAKPAAASRKPKGISPEQALANTQSLLEAKKNRDAQTSYPGAQPHGKPATPQGFMSQEAQDRFREQEKGQLIHTNIHGLGNDKNTSSDHH